jgi:hypothetical protein
VLKEKYLGNSDNRTRWFDVVPSSLRFPTNPHTSLYRLDLDVPFSSFTHATHQQTTLVMLVLPTECLNRITADPKRGIETGYSFSIACHQLRSYDAGQVLSAIDFGRPLSLHDFRNIQFNIIIRPPYQRLPSIQPPTSRHLYR